MYMLDGGYQSVMCFFLPYLLFAPANTNTDNGNNVNDYKQFGVYVANATIVVVNTYILLNTYRWDWFMVLITTISTLLIFLWTGAYTSFTASFTFYGGAKHCYGQLSFWAMFLLTVIVCLLPRFTIKSFQKMFRPRDIDIVREQLRQGRFDYLKNVDPEVAGIVSPTEKNGVVADSASSSEISKPSDHARNGSANPMSQDDDRRPIYPPSLAHTQTTSGHPYSPQGSDGTAEIHSHRASLDRAFGPINPSEPSRASLDVNSAYTGAARPPPISPIESSGVSGSSPRISIDRPRPSFDRLRTSMDMSRTRPSFEASHDFTSAAYLQKVESSHSGYHTPTQGSGLRNDSSPHLS